MISVFKNSWALLLGMLLLMTGNGIQAALIGYRGPEFGFSQFEISMIISAYFAGFLFSSRITPVLIRRVGHVRVYAALASLVSAALILFPALPYWPIWILGRFIIGFGFCGVYVVSESWLNDASDNQTRGQALSAYMLVQSSGLILAQWFLVTPDASGFILFIIPSVLVSVSFAPVLLSVSPTPAFEATKPMTLRHLFQVSPLTFVGLFLLGGVYAGQFGGISVFGQLAGLTISQLAMVNGAIYVGAMVAQYPLGWLSDRMDRRALIIAISGAAGAACITGVYYWENFTLLVLCAGVIGAMSNPLYSLFIAHANDYLDKEDMASASAGMLFVNGSGAVMGPLLLGWSMDAFGAGGYFVFLAAVLLGIAVYGLYRSTQRATVAVEESGAYAPIMPTSTPVAMEYAQEYAIEMAEEAEEIAEAEAEADSERQARWSNNG